MAKSLMSETGRGLTIVFTGDGKGKTTAALGLLVRAVGHNMKVKMLQFIKTGGVECGEYRVAEQLGVKILPLGAGFTWNQSGNRTNAEMAEEAWNLACQEIAFGSTDILVLDEITYALQSHWLDLDEVLDIIAGRPSAMHIAFTGRSAPDKLIDAADLVTEMHEVKHPFRQGIRGQAGIEY